MKEVTAKITGNNNLLGKFELEHGETGVVTQYGKDIKSVTFSLKEGTKYYIGIVVYGDDDQKYKIEISGATTTQYPTSEMTLDNGYDDIVAKVVV
ncbi:MAG: hypothetical protein ABJK64_01860 [Paraglaciecola sp.]|uniref:hypothetical protein n=1 Tax=Paraglaciecola sp. TaxID=1920173 RepID=UPI0032973804